MAVTQNELNEWKIEMEAISKQFTRGIDSTIKLYQKKRDLFKKLHTKLSEVEYEKTRNELAKWIKVGDRMLGYYDRKIPVLIDILEGLLFELKLRKVPEIKKGIKPLLYGMKAGRKKIKKLLALQKSQENIKPENLGSDQFKALLNKERKQLFLFMKKFHNEDIKQFQDYVTELKRQMRSNLGQRVFKAAATGTLASFGFASIPIGLRVCSKMMDNLMNANVQDPGAAFIGVIAIITPLAMMGGVLFITAAGSFHLLSIEPD